MRKLIKFNIRGRQQPSPFIYKTYTAPSREDLDILNSLYRTFEKDVQSVSLLEDIVVSANFEITDQQKFQRFWQLVGLMSKIRPDHTGSLEIVDGEEVVNWSISGGKFNREEVPNGNENTQTDQPKSN